MNNPLESAKGIIEAGGKIADNVTTTLEEEGEFMNDRYALEMTSDNRLTKNIRPLFLIFVCLAYVGTLIASIWIKVPAELITVLNVWGTTAIGFFFGGRTLEKASKIRRKQRRKDGK